ncbi:hypothetical protein CLV28_2422 [Sediminihabitans luteus]|uniref:Thrombospondin type 3 repeat-containing protein n=1 Tax=Sediminihabitans luteus TaxID=1138585 RepID=A0A2M9CDK1_9CELL|nr:hypothetical protein [Sediminihabitans luteus]PJJ69945.1 hypothetical protein CLV28_2422 [Sediminihabitans luteus]GII99265.1 hypothetical protein Slu03_16430 [Sediminihabitans luteus]
MGANEVTGATGDADPTPPARATSVAPRRRSITGVVAAAAVLAVAGAYGLVQVPADVARAGEPVTRTIPVDTDRDGLPDQIEIAGWVTQDGRSHRTDPALADSDGDGLTDLDEAGAPRTTTVVAGGPAVEVVARRGVGPARTLAGAVTGAVRVALTRTTYDGYADPLVPDTDGDGLGDGDEADLGLDPLAPDTDGDGLPDGTEVDVVGSDPEVADTDGDGFDDGYEDGHRESQGLDPLVADVKVSTAEYATDVARGFVLGDLSPGDSLAWLTGNLASGGASFIPGVGWLVGGAADVRDVVGAAIHGDWVGAGFNATGLVPVAGDEVSITAKVSKFLARNPKLVAAVAAKIVTLKVPDRVKIAVSKVVWKESDRLRAAGVSEKTLLRLATGRHDLDALAASLERSIPIKGFPSRFFESGLDGERALANFYGAATRGKDVQVRALTADCIAVCNAHVRVFDVLVDGVAHESKVGYVTLTAGVERQIRSDAWLVEHGDIQGAHWHFFASGTSNTVGASPQTLDLLDELGIGYTIHLPA